MRLSDLKIANLQALVAVAETESFSRAAEVLHVTQPTVSRRVADLEAVLNTKLFDRLEKRVLLNDVGKELYQHANHILRTLKDTRNAIDNLSDEVMGQLKLGVSGYIAEVYLRPILQKFTEQYPNVELDINLFGSSANAYKRLQEGELDLVLSTLPMKSKPEYQQHIIWHDKLAFVCSKQHALAKKKMLSLSELASYPAIVPESDTMLGTIINQRFAKKHLKLRFAPQIPSPANFPMIKMLVSLGLGWSVLPEIILDNTFVTLPVKGLVRELGIIHLKKRSLSKAAREFITICLAAIV
tara:strand:+ start:79785 stop:80678 length:894 start_codon:yes stop_codon:yes gene_type:complete